MPRKKKRKPQLTINGVTLRNKFEAYAYEQLLKADFKDVQYEGTTFLLLPKLQFPNICVEGTKKKLRNIKSILKAVYTPDFIVNDTHIIETKGHRRPDFNARWKLFKHYIIKNNLPYKLYMPRNNEQVDKIIELIKEDESK